MNLLIEIEKDKFKDEFRYTNIEDIKDKKYFNKIGQLIFLSKITEIEGLFNVPKISTLIDSTYHIQLVNLFKLIEKFIDDKTNTYNNFKEIILYLKNNLK